MDFGLVLCEKCGRMFPTRYCPDCGAKLQLDEKDREKKLRAEKRRFIEPEETKSPWECAIRGLVWEIATDMYQDMQEERRDLMNWSKIAVAGIAAAAWLATVAMLGKVALVLAVPAVLICMLHCD